MRLLWPNLRKTDFSRGGHKFGSRLPTPVGFMPDIHRPRPGGRLNSGRLARRKILDGGVGAFLAYPPFNDRLLAAFTRIAHHSRQNTVTTDHRQDDVAWHVGSLVNLVQRGPRIILQVVCHPSLGLLNLLQAVRASLAWILKTYFSAIIAINNSHDDHLTILINKTPSFRLALKQRFSIH